MMEKTKKGVYVGRQYKAKDAVRIVNMKQAAFYWNEFDVLPLDIYPSRDYDSGEPMLVVVFKRDETTEAYKAWMDRKYKNDNVRIDL